MVLVIYYDSIWVSDSLQLNSVE